MNSYPLRVEARRDEPLSRGLWLVKWLLLIPHYVVLAVLWTGLVVLTLAAYLAVLVTGRYPRSIEAYNLGVLRWTWRVGFYGYGALGTDRYPPFTLADVADYPARLQLDEPSRPPRWLPLVAWLFAIPHLFVLAALAGAVTWTYGDNDGRSAMGVVAAAIVVVGGALLFTGRYPAGLFDLVVGVIRWNLRVAAYLMLLTPRYPPLRLDQGGTEPGDLPDDHPRPAGPGRSRSAAGPVTALIAGVVLLLPALGAGVAGGGLLALNADRDDDGFVASRLVNFSSSTAAITAEDVKVYDADRWVRDLAGIDQIRITTTATGNRPVFVGIGPRAAVDRWLSATTHDRITGVTGRHVTYQRESGSMQVLPNPAGQDFWLASAFGPRSATLTWTVSEGDFTVVLANLGGAPGVSADVRAAMQIADVTSFGVTLLITGGVLLVIALTLIIVGGVGLGRRHGGPPTGPGPDSGPPEHAPPPDRQPVTVT
ncbi:DUF4389 domain-containing protein [Actinoplanes sp. NPDC023714]|uniref:DUF4389 domain-containing protein n=1 Tax=Actinoplanes sp. NPDC023714 TaxID=3154322 RepID=UPI0033D2293E